MLPGLEPGRCSRVKPFPSSPTPLGPDAIFIPKAHAEGPDFSEAVVWEKDSVKAEDESQKKQTIG